MKKTIVGIYIEIILHAWEVIQNMKDTGRKNKMPKITENKIIGGKLDQFID